MLVWAIVITLFCAWWGGHIMEGKGRSKGTGIALGLLLGLIGVAICGMMSTDYRAKAEREVFEEMERQHARDRLR